MSLEVRKTDLPGVLHLQPETHPDDRGFFRELLHGRKLDQHIDEEFVQFNHSRSRQHVIRGLHYQLNHPQGKLVSVVRGEIFDVAVEIREGSPTFGDWTARRLEAGRGNQLFVPPDFAHGFCVLSETADVVYACTEFYDAHDDRGIHWDDSTLGIDWPVENPVVSEKDASLPSLKEAETPSYSEPVSP